MRKLLLFLSLMIVGGLPSVFANSGNTVPENKKITIENNGVSNILNKNLVEFQIVLDKNKYISKIDDANLKIYDKNGVELDKGKWFSISVSSSSYFISDNVYNIDKITYSFSGKIYETKVWVNIWFDTNCYSRIYDDIKYNLKFISTESKLSDSKIKIVENLGKIMKQDCSKQIPKITERKIKGKTITITYDKEIIPFVWKVWTGGTVWGDNKNLVIQVIWGYLNGKSYNAEYSDKYGWNNLIIEKFGVSKTDNKKLIIILKNVPLDRFDILVTVEQLMFKDWSYTPYLWDWGLPILDITDAYSPWKWGNWSFLDIDYDISKYVIPNSMGNVEWKIDYYNVQAQLSKESEKIYVEINKKVRSGELKRGNIDKSTLKGIFEKYITNKDDIDMLTDYVHTLLTK